MLAAHDVSTVTYLRWNGLRNGELLRKAAADGFDVLITLDTGIEHQHNLKHLPISIILREPRKQEREDVARLVPALLDALVALAPRAFVKLSEK